jgi:ABC-type dipeptide/oligopeptide/nickel transport system permease component
MIAYTLRRLAVAVPMMLGAMTIVFFAMRILPGDPCIAVMGDEATKEALADCVKNLGLDRPLAVQYLDYLSHSLRFDFGRSFRQGYPVTEYILEMVPHTLLLVFASTVVAMCIGLPAGVLSAIKRRSPMIDYTFRIGALLGLSMPVFWLGILLLITFSLHWNVFPLIGGGDLSTAASRWRRRSAAWPAPRCSRSSVRTTSARRGRRACASGPSSTSTRSGT